MDNFLLGALFRSSWSLSSSLSFFAVIYFFYPKKYLIFKGKIKASAWKTIRKTQYDRYEDYFQVFRGFSKKSYPDI